MAYKLSISSLQAPLLRNKRHVGVCLTRNIFSGCAAENIAAFRFVSDEEMEKGGWDGALC